MFRPRLSEHFIDNGRVYCPVRERDVEVDLCASCRWTASIDLSARAPLVRCRPESSPVWIMRPWL